MIHLLFTLSYLVIEWLGGGMESTCSMMCSNDSWSMKKGHSHSILSNKDHLVFIFSAIAASAPVFWFFDSGIEEDIYDRIVTRTATSSGCELKAVTSGFEAISNLGKTGEVKRNMKVLIDCI